MRPRVTQTLHAFGARMTRNRQWRLKAHPGPDEIIGPEHFELVEAEVPALGDDEFLVRTLMLGTSPAQRGYTDPRSMSAQDLVQMGEVMRGRGFGVIEATYHPDFDVGEWVSASVGWQDYSVQRLGRGLIKSMNVMSIQKVDPAIRPSSLHLGTLGTAGYTAMIGLTQIADITPGKTVVVSAAAGGVGSMAVQVAKASGCRVVGIAGGPEKCAWLSDHLGCDVTIDYKKENVDKALSAACPNGLDVYFDNVGGELLNTALLHLADGARILICGYISTQYKQEQPTGPGWYTRLLIHRARMEGFVTWDHVAQFPAFHSQLKAWYEAGEIKAVEDVRQGLEFATDSLRALFTGDNQGVCLTRVSADP